MGEWSTVIKTISTALGALTGYMFGGWSLLIHILLVFVIIDWLTGWAAAWINGELRSRVGYYGIARKVAIFLLIMVSHFIDMALGGLQYFQNAVIFFYLANELLSIIENVGRMGVPIPQVLRGAVKVFNKKSGEGEKEDNADTGAGEEEVRRTS
ncbi:phage holin family protein [Paenibacillus sp. BR1-192]|uniref:phage holin family protein n=1 Tax=Paenibacillus sp. BR1-192 TaxID=3032287 RepID=UPI00240D88D5|nr:phage holin family protein [Paenibacillus sp. BR1-192]WFB57464.1 phage holin family protein [Paenibacillus sp. BR1-192]